MPVRNLEMPKPVNSLFSILLLVSMEGCYASVALGVGPLVDSMGNVGVEAKLTLASGADRPDGERGGAGLAVSGTTGVLGEQREFYTGLQVGLKTDVWLKQDRVDARLGALFSGRFFWGGNENLGSVGPALFLSPMVVVKDFSGTQILFGPGFQAELLFGRQNSPLGLFSLLLNFEVRSHHRPQFLR